MDDGIDGLVHVSEISWSRRKNAAADSYKKGLLVDALVLNIDGEHKKFSLSMKRLKDDPWKGLPERFHTGDVVDGYVTSITDFGVFVELEEGIEGLIHLSELDEGKGKHPSEVFKVDDPVKVVIINVDERDKRIGLSTKALKTIEEKSQMDSLAKDDNRAFSTLGDILGSAMREGNQE